MKIKKTKAKTLKQDSEYLVVRIYDPTMRDALRHFLANHKSVTDVGTLSPTQVNLLQDSAKDEAITTHLSLGI